MLCPSCNKFAAYDIWRNHKYEEITRENVIAAINALKNWARAFDPDFAKQEARFA